jgi:hypothetical protein
MQAAHLPSVWHRGQVINGLRGPWAVVTSTPHAVVVLAVMVGQVQQAATWGQQGCVQQAGAWLVHDTAESRCI